MATDAQISELFSYVLDLAATQTATLRLLKELGVDPKAIDAEIQQEKIRIGQIGVVADLRLRKDLSQLSTTVRTVGSVRWDH